MLGPQFSPPQTDEQRAEYALSLQIAGEDKMSQFAFKAASDYMIAAADIYVNIAKTSKNSELVARARQKLGPLLDRVLQINFTSPLD